MSHPLSAERNKAPQGLFSLEALDLIVPLILNGITLLYLEYLSDLNLESNL